MNILGTLDKTLADITLLSMFGATSLWPLKFWVCNYVVRLTTNRFQTD